MSDWPATLSPIGMVFVLLGAIAWLVSRRLFVAVLSAAAPLAATAAVTVGGSSVPPFYLLAVPATISAVLGVTRHGIGHRALRLLSVFVVWAGLVTLVGPLLFAGMPVLGPRTGIDSAVHEPTPLAFTMSMAAQMVYLVLAVGVVFFVAQSDELHPGVLSTGIVFGTLASALTLLPAARPWVDVVFKEYASAQFNPWEVRHSGVFPEPSYLATFSFAAVVYCVHRATGVRGWRRVGLASVAVVALANGLLTESGTFAASVAIAGAALVVLVGFRLLRSGVTKATAVVLLVVAAALLVENRPVLALWEVITGKVLTESFGNRTLSNWYSLDVAADTWGLGVGLGADRPSSFALLLLSNVGVVGFALYAAVVARALGPASRIAAWRPVVTAVLALLLAKVVAEPALSTPLLWLGLGLCVSAVKARPGRPVLPGRTGPTTPGPQAFGDAPPPPASPLATPPDRWGPGRT